MGNLTVSQTPSSLPDRAVLNLPPLSPSMSDRVLHREHLPRQTPDYKLLPDPSIWEMAPATMGNSEPMQTLRSKVRRIAPYFRTALLYGPSGTGKEGVARMLHAFSPAIEAAFFPFRASDLAEAIIRNHQEVGHLFPPNMQTTLFLDEVCDLPPSLQRTLLSLWSPENRYWLRIVAGTHRDLHTMSMTGHFRPDLLQKLSGVELAVPPLSERMTDLPKLAETILSGVGVSHTLSITDGAIKRLLQHHWPGDLAELETCLCSALRNTNGSPVIRLEDLPDLIPVNPEEDAVDDLDRLDDVIQRHVLAVLTRCRGNKVRAAEVLGISRSTLYRMLESRLTPDFAD